MNMVMTGLMGLYVGRIYNEVKRRPLYVVSERVGFEESAVAEDATRKVG
jgi:dolichol-phosphate mannosyltransferase